MSVWTICYLWTYISRDHSGRCWAWGSFWLRKAQGQEKQQFPALINECMGRSFCLRDQRPADTCSGTEMIINKDPAFVSSWAPLNLFDLNEEEEETLNITLWRFSEKSLHSCGTAARSAGTWTSPRYHNLGTLTIRHFILKPAYFYFLSIQSCGFLKWTLEEMTLWYGWSCIEYLRWWMMIYRILLHSSWRGIVWLQERY